MEGWNCNTALLGRFGLLVVMALSTKAIAKAEGRLEESPNSQDIDAMFEKQVCVVHVL